MMPVRLEPAAPRSRVKHSTTEPLSSQMLSLKCYKPLLGTTLKRYEVLDASKQEIDMIHAKLKKKSYDKRWYGQKAEYSE